MIDVPPELPIEAPQHIERKLIDCGIEQRLFAVNYEDDLRSIVIVVDDTAKIEVEQFSCIRAASGDGIVDFKNDRTQLAYDDFVSELVRPELLKSAEAELEKRGLLVNFPKRASFPDFERYAEALEAHCGMAPGSALRAVGQDIIFEPSMTGDDFADFNERYSCIISLLMYASANGDATFGFIGNEAVPPAPENR